MTICLGKSCSFGLPRVPFVKCRQFMYLVISLLVLRAGCGIWLYQVLIIAYLFTYNGENVVDTIAPSFFIRSSSNLQVTRTCIKSQNSVDFSQIWPLSFELLALERQKKKVVDTTWLYFLSDLLQPCKQQDLSFGRDWSIFFFNQVTMKLVNKQNRHKVMDKFEIWQHPAIKLFKKLVDNLDRHEIWVWNLAILRYLLCSWLLKRASPYFTFWACWISGELPLPIGLLVLLCEKIVLILSSVKQWIISLTCHFVDTFIYDRIIIKLAGNQVRHRISDEFEFRSYLSIHSRVTCPWALEKLWTW